jgi:hypothetical protein
LGAIGAIWLLTSIAGVVQGGDLDPPGAPGSTMQTLDDLVPSWHKSISGSGRFKNFQAEGYVLDRETGVVWEQTPSMTTMDWDSAAHHCWNRTVAGELASSKGWRLPTVEELATLIEPGVSGTPKLPGGHPFSGISGLYWSATASTAGVFEKYYWDSGTTSLALSTNTYSVPMRAWCVRAPGGFDNVSDNLS